ncbi:MAG: hypothetical protein ACPGOY_08505 [Rhodospirillaceae bacterium]
MARFRSTAKPKPPPKVHKDGAVARQTSGFRKGLALCACVIGLSLGIDVGRGQDAQAEVIVQEFSPGASQGPSFSNTQDLPLKSHQIQLSQGPQQAQCARTQQGIALALPPGWALLHRERGHGLHRESWVPQPQKTGAWTDMVVAQSSRNAPPSVKELHQAMAEDHQRQCTQSNAGQAQINEADGSTQGFWIISCGALQSAPGGQVTMVFYQTDGQRGDLIQRIWRTDRFGPEGPPIPGPQQQEAVEILKFSKACGLP